GVEFEITDLDGYTVVDANGNEIDKVYTDSNGKIRLSLTEGLYKATETKPLEGYATPELYTGIGIGASKEAEVTISNDWSNYKDQQMDISDIANLDGNALITSHNSKILLTLDDFGNIIDKRMINYRHLDEIYVYEDNIYVTSNEVLIKLDKEFNIIFQKDLDLNAGDIKINEEGIFIKNLNSLMKVDFEGNLIFEKELDNYMYSLQLYDNAVILCGNTSIVIYDFDGNKLSEIIRENDEYYFSSMDVLDDGIVVSTNDGKIIKYGIDGNVIWNNFEKSFNYTEVIKSDNAIFALASNGTVVKYSLVGEFISENHEKEYSYSEGVFVGDGIVVYTNDGEVVKYSNDNVVMYEKMNIVESEGAIIKDEYYLTANWYPGRVLKFDMYGNLIWKSELLTSVGLYDIAESTNYIITTDQLGYIYRLDLEGNYVDKLTTTYSNCDLEHISIYEDIMYFVGTNWNSTTRIYEDLMLCIKEDKTILWSNLNLEEINDEYSAILAVSDGVIAATTEGLLMKFNYLNGEQEWTVDVQEQYNDIKMFEDDFIAVSESGTVMRFDSDGNIIWKNNQLTKSLGTLTVHNDEIYTIGKDDSTNIYKFDINGNLIYNKSYKYVAGAKELFFYNDNLYGIARGGLNKYKAEIISPQIPNSQNITIENEIIKYKITTKVEGYGGTISGKDEEPYEQVKYKENSTKDIIAIPSEGYKVKSLTINGVPIEFNENSDGTVSLEKFVGMVEDKEVIVSFAKINSSLILEKKDSTNSNPLANAKFNIKQLEIRNEPVKEQIIGEIVANGEEYTKEIITLEDKVENVVGELTNNNDTYYFVEENGVYVPNNIGISNTTANSYIEIDLTNYTGTYAIVVNSNVSSESGYDFGYATITQTTSAPTYNSAEGQFMKISGTSTDVTTPKDYMISLEGGNIYYLHLGYRKDSSGNIGNDKVTINSIDLYNATSEITSCTYKFVDNGNGGYESNNQGQASTTANSYIPIDLTGCEGKYNLIVNANVSSQSNCDFGYVTVTTTTNSPAYNSYEGQILKISGGSSWVTAPKDYSTVIEGGKLYYLHFGYYKNNSTDSGEDKFTVNSINLTLNQDEFIDTDVTTNSSGEAVIELNDGRYQITEIEAPEGYTLNSTPIIYDFVAGQENIITVENDPQVDIIVHHYLKGTTTSVAPDETQKGDLGKEYTTQPKMDLVDYQLVKNEDGSYQIPDNASGVYTEETQVITYYYELAPVQLIVHHYIDGTEDSVAPDVTSE
ncbi:MAG: PQQ-binding-like beta-propeller repeat protein, partial [Clostridia bacterium]|nr:PQQ-binding-like beta-propeller repeat protein [Clostridia bacterium]